MVNGYVDIQEDILRLAREHADELLAFAQSHWNELENIDSGMSGALLFLMEFYERSGEQKYLMAVDRMIDRLLIYCADNPTNDYSLYTGRAGVVYMLLRRLSMGQNEYLIQKCLELMVPANGAYLHNSYTTDYLYDGRAGTLLVLIHLYRLTKERFVLDYVEQFVNRILFNARMCEAGIYWRAREELNLKPSCGFARGAAGVSYVLRQLKCYCGAPILGMIIDGVDRYLNSNWINKSLHWGNNRKDITDQESLTNYKQAYLNGDHNLFVPRQNFFWANGTIGVLLSGSSDIYKKRPGIVPDIIEGVVGEGLLSEGSLYSGLPGIGLALLEMDHPGTGEWQKTICMIQEKVLARLPDMDLGEGLLHGITGANYFLLRTVGLGRGRDNILFPFGNERPASDGMEIAIRPDFVTLQKNLFSRSYPRIFYLLEKIAPDILLSYKNQAGGYLEQTAEKFEKFIRDGIFSGAMTLNREFIMDLLRLEKEKQDFMRAETRSSFQLYLEDILFIDSVMKILGQPDDLVKYRTLSISNKIRIVDTRWDWAYINDTNKINDRQTQTKLMHNLNKQPKEFRYVLQMGRDGEVSETKLTLAGTLILNRFIEPKPMRQAIAELIQYVRSLSSKSLHLLLIELEYIETISAGEFLTLLEDMVYGQIRFLAYRGILTFD